MARLVMITLPFDKHDRDGRRKSTEEDEHAGHHHGHAH
jgi:hypothetical protein